MPHSNNLCYVFGPFRFNSDLRLLTRDQEVLALGEKAAEVLLFLLRNAGDLVGKDDLMKGVWPDSFVEENNLTQNIFTLRRALGDDPASALYIETVPRRGYRFVAEVRKEFGPSSGVSGAGENAERGTELPPILGVLPLINATGSDALEYLGEGISDNIINNLSRISKLRVMSRSSMFRYKGRQLEPKKIASELNVDAMLVGKIVLRPKGMTISVELVDNSGVALWGDSYDCEMKDILEIQDEIARQISGALRLKLTGEEEKRITTRYTESSDAYQAYMEGRFHWSRYTRSEIEDAIEHFREAIELDPNYALAYSGIVDCYLRLATNYLPPENYLRSTRKSVEHEELKSYRKNKSSKGKKKGNFGTQGQKIKLRHEWDWKGAERELRRANELKTNYPAAHQWHAAYLFCRRLSQTAQKSSALPPTFSAEKDELSGRIPSTQLTAIEEVQVFCTVAREQVDVGNYEAACLVLNRWWTLGKFPQVRGLSSECCADLLFTTGELAGFVASAKQISTGQKNGETLLSGSIAFFEQLGSPMRSAEGRIELALCYYRQGNFDLARSVLRDVLSDLPSEENELRSLILIRLASLERHAGHLRDALARLEEAKSFVEVSGPWASGRRHLELGSTYKDLAVAEGDDSLFERSMTHHRTALYEFEAIGNLRLMAITENNIGFLKISSHQLNEAATHLDNAWDLFDQLGDRVRRAQVDDTVARLHLESGRFNLADEAATRAVATFEGGDEEALLAEALTTKGMVYARLQRYVEAKRLFELAHSVALRCGDREGSGRSLLIMIEEMATQLTSDERRNTGERMVGLLQNSEQPTVKLRVENALELIENLS